MVTRSRSPSSRETTDCGALDSDVEIPMGPRSTIGRIPVTVLSGFLGSGKTTLLEYALTNSQNRRVAILVNDMANVNIDAELIKKKKNATGTGGDGTMVELKNGCICCTLNTSLLPEIHRLVSTCKGGLDAIIIEGSGIAEPQPIAQAFADGPQDLVRLDTMVTVIDSERFLVDYKQGHREMVGGNERLRETEGASEFDSRKIVSLLVDQVELADVIVLNKNDLVSAAQLDELHSIVSTLNPDARIEISTFGRLDLDKFLCTGLHVAKKDYAAADWGGQGVRTVGKIRSFVYQRDRPMHPGRLEQLVRTWYESGSSVLRAKGFVWVATRPSSSVFWALAGNHLRLQDGGNWGDGETGDGARQDIVFIGMDGMEDEKIIGKLDACLLSEKEFRRPGEWMDFPDPIVLMPKSFQELAAVEERVRRGWAPAAVALSLFTIGYNLIEAGVAIEVGLQTESLGLVGFGMDSLIEVSSAIFVLIRLWSEFGDLLPRSVCCCLCPGRANREEAYSRRGSMVGSRQKAGAGTGTEAADRGAHADVDGDTKTTRIERWTTTCIGLLLAALGFGTFITSCVNLGQGERPDTTAPGLAISIVSLLLMGFIWYAKLYVSVIIDSSTLERDAACSLGCIKLSCVLLLGSALYAADEGLWWADSACALIISIMVGYEGGETVWAAQQPDFDGCVCCSRGQSWLYNRLRRHLRSGSGALRGVSMPHSITGTQSAPQQPTPFNPTSTKQKKLASPANLRSRPAQSSKRQKKTAQPRPTSKTDGAPPHSAPAWSGAFDSKPEQPLIPAPEAPERLESKAFDSMDKRRGGRGEWREAEGRRDGEEEGEIQQQSCVAGPKLSSSVPLLSLPLHSPPPEKPLPPPPPRAPDGTDSVATRKKNASVLEDDESLSCSPRTSIDSSDSGTGSAYREDTDEGGLSEDGEGNGEGRVEASMHNSKKLAPWADGSTRSRLSGIVEEPKGQDCFVGSKTDSCASQSPSPSPVNNSSDPPRVGSVSFSRREAGLPQGEERHEPSKVASFPPAARIGGFAPQNYPSTSPVALHRTPSPSPAPFISPAPSLSPSLSPHNANRDPRPISLSHSHSLPPRFTSDRPHQASSSHHISSISNNASSTSSFTTPPPSSHTTVSMAVPSPLPSSPLPARASSSQITGRCNSLPLSRELPNCGSLDGHSRRAPGTGMSQLTGPQRGILISTSPRGEEQVRKSGSFKGLNMDMAGADGELGEEARLELSAGSTEETSVRVRAKTTPPRGSHVKTVIIEV